MYDMSREVIERVVGKRGKLHRLEYIDPARCDCAPSRDRKILN